MSVPDGADGRNVPLVSVPASKLVAVDDSRASAAYIDEAAIDPQTQHNIVMKAIYWYLAWAMPALGMFSEAYIVFSLGQTTPLQKIMYPNCFGPKTPAVATCSPELIKVQNYIQICGIMAGMLLYGFIGDLTGRKWGSRMVALTMFSGVILLIGSPWTPYGDGTGYHYLCFFLVAQTWYGFGVGGEYPMASSSAAERAASTPSMQMYRGRQVILVFSGQGQGNFVNSCVILVCLYIFGQTGASSTLTFKGAQQVITLQYGIGAAIILLMIYVRFFWLHESKVWKEEKKDYNELSANGARNKWLVALWFFWPRLFVGCFAWIANDFVFYGSKLFQNLFVQIVVGGTPTTYYNQQWTTLNNFVALNGYYWAAWLVDKKWYGRRRCQNVGFAVVFVLFTVCACRFPYLSGQYQPLSKGGPTTGTPDLTGPHWFMFLYFFSSFWQQFGPNATTWLVAGEMFPTDIRATFHGICACAGKLGAIVSAVAYTSITISNPTPGPTSGFPVDSGYELIFALNAGFSVFGFAITWLWLPDTTGLQLEENDRLFKYALAGEFHHYHGEAINPRHLSPWEVFLLRWHKSYDPEADRRHREVQALELAKQVQA